VPSETIIALGIGAVVVGGAVVLARRARAAEEESDICDSFEGNAKTACQAAKGALGVLGAINKLLSGPNFAAIDKKNKELNGPVDVSATEWIAATFCHTQVGDAGGSPVMPGAALRFANGCVPIDGHPDMAKCAPGTKSIVSQVHCPYSKTRKLGYPVSDKCRTTEDFCMVKTDWSKAFTGEVGDPTTVGPFAAGQKLFNVERNKGLPATYTAVPSGSLGYYAGGKLVTCPADRPAVVVRDNRTGKSTVQCGALKSIGNASEQTGTRTDVTNPTQEGFIWVNDHWERPRHTP